MSGAEGLYLDISESKHIGHSLGTDTANGSKAIVSTYYNRRKESNNFFYESIIEE